MKKDELFEKAFDQIDDELIVNAQTAIPLTKRNRPKVLLVAAICPLILLSVILLSFWIANREPTVFLPSSSTTPKTVTVNSLLKLHTHASEFIFKGEYDENGKVLDMWYI